MGHYACLSYDLVNHRLAHVLVYRRLDCQSDITQTKKNSGDRLNDHQSSFLFVVSYSVKSVIF